MTRSLEQKHDMFACELVGELTDLRDHVKEFSRKAKELFVRTTEPVTETTVLFPSHPLIETYYTVAEDNSNNLEHHFRQHSSCKDFLENEDLRASFHPTAVDTDQQTKHLKLKFDIDGVVVNLKSFSSIKMPLHYIQFEKPTKRVVKPVFHLLKKHFLPGHYTENHFKCFKASKGIHLAYSQGWQLLMCLLPDKDQPLYWDPANMDTATVKYFSDMEMAICNSLKSLSKQDMVRPTIRKNKLYDLSKFNILPHDQDFILTLIDKAAISMQPPNGLMLFIFMCKFGQKQIGPFNIGELFEMTNIESCSIHSACDVLPANGKVHHFWSKYALLALVGGRGATYSALTLREAVNFQSNLDGKRMTVDKDLLGIATFPHNVTFIQLYADTPHNRMGGWRSHPISGENVCCRLLHPKSVQSMAHHSDSYLRHMKDLSVKLQGTIVARVEIVTLLTAAQITTTINAADLFHPQCLKHLIESRPMLMPFLETDKEDSFMGIMGKLATHLTETLEAQRGNAKAQGRFAEAWTAYQYEMALEIFFWGHTVSSQDKIYSINLGVATDCERSLTWQRGILGLLPFNSATSENEHPPLSHWVKKPLQVTRVSRLFGFADHLEASYPVLGQALLKIIICDLYLNNRASLKLLVQDSPPHGTCVGIVSAEHVVSLLSDVRCFKYPATFYRAAQILAESGHSLKEVLESGLQSSRIKFFPAFKMTDAKKLSWNKKHFYNIVSAQQEPTLDARVGVMSGDVAVCLVSRNLTYERNLADAKENGMPWMREVLSRLVQEKGLSSNQMLLVCTFVSCVALIQQGIYVDYSGLLRLEMELPLSQARLRNLHIQSHILFSSFRMSKLYRLHPDIPFKLKPSQPQKNKPKQQHVNKKVRLEPPSDSEGEELARDLEHEDGQTSHTPSLVVPAGSKKHWSQQEIQLVMEAQLKTTHSSREAYKVYIHSCLQKRIPMRSFRAFQIKLARIK